MISTHRSAANRIRIGQERSILCLRGTSSAGNAMVMRVQSSRARKYPGVGWPMARAKIQLSPHIWAVPTRRRKLAGKGAPVALGGASICAPLPTLRPDSNLEDLRVARLDLLARLVDAVRVLLHQLDVGEFA